MNYNPLPGGLTSSGNRPRLDLKKRVAYPLQGTVAGNAAGTVIKPTAIVPPNQLLASLSPPLPPSLVSNRAMSPAPINIAVVHPMPQNAPIIHDENSLDLPENALLETLQILRCQIPCIPDSSNLRQEDIRSRIMLIERQWQSGALSVNLKQRIYQLGQAIKNRNYTIAMQIYTYLVINDSNHCPAWATALRHIILTIEERGERNTSAIGSQARNSNNNNIPATTSGSVNNVNMFVANNSNHHSSGTATAVQHI